MHLDQRGSPTERPLIRRIAFGTRCSCTRRAADLRDGPERERSSDGGSAGWMRHPDDPPAGYHAAPPGRSFQRCAAVCVDCPRAAARLAAPDRRDAALLPVWGQEHGQPCHKRAPRPGSRRQWRALQTSLTSTETLTRFPVPHLRGGVAELLCWQIKVPGGGARDRLRRSRRLAPSASGPVAVGVPGYPARSRSRQQPILRA